MYLSALAGPSQGLQPQGTATPPGIKPGGQGQQRGSREGPQFVLLRDDSPFTSMGHLGQDEGELRGGRHREHRAREWVHSGLGRLPH
jgi:hypothetical protein